MNQHAASSSSSPSMHLTSHPLLDDEPSPRAGRRTPRRERISATEAPASSSSGYFSLKARLENDARTGSGNWDGSVRGRGIKVPTRASSTSLPGMWDAPASTPVVMIDSAASQSATNDDELYNDIATAVSGGSDRDAVARVMATPWHTLSDSSLYSALDEQGQPQFAVLRTLSAATERLLKVRKELEEGRRILQEKEDARRTRGTALLEELPQNERDIARRVLASLFTSDDEEGHRVVRRQSRVSIAETLSEAMGEEVLSTSVKDDPTETLTTTASRVKSAPTVLETIESVPSTPMPDDGAPDTARPVVVHESSVEGTEIGIPDTDASTFPETEVSLEPASDAGSLPSSRSRSQDTRSVVSARSERSTSGVGEWMGTLWGRRKPKEVDTESESVASKDESQSVEPERTRSAPNIGTTTTSEASSTDGPEKTVKDRKDKERRSVFGSLGLSLLAGSGARKKRPALSTDFTPPASVPPSAVESTFPQEITSPEEPVPPSLTTATASALPTATSSPAESIAATSADRPPQGATIPALVAATRVMTADASSILIDIDVAPSIAEGALHLIQHVRDTGLDVRKAVRPRQHKRKSSLAAKLQQLQVPGKEEAGLEKEVPNKRLGVAATMASVLPASGFASPLLGSFLPQQRRAVGNPPAASSSGQTQATDQPAPPPLRSVALDAIIPATSRPPTAYLSREYSAVTLPSAAAAHGDLRPTLAQHISSFRPAYVQHMSSSRVARSGEGGVLADRFGFTYDAGVYDLMLLMRARKAGCAAPACLTGVRIADREENPEASDDEDAAVEAGVDVVQGPCACNGSFERDVDEVSVASGVSGRSKKDGREKEKDGNEGKKDLHAVLALSSDTPRHVCDNVMHSLLNELSVLHDAHQASRRKEWDAFLAQRARATQASNASGPRQAANNGGFPRGLDTSDAPADELSHSEGLINVNALSTASRKDLTRLARAGVPLALRTKVWLECTGALEMREPGAFEELLGAPGDLGVEGEIEKDVGRTMPLNLFFGGDGAGVGKLRRVLVAYSRRNPGVGYCQGMNLLAATLLLVHAAEEDAFWAFTALLERVLPTGFFSPTLLPSRACPLVLLELVREHLPKLFVHLQELGIDLPAICFSWFLSLFTDCLPIETLFRAWDVLIVDGFDVLFRLALSILRIGEPELLACASVPAAYVALESLPTRMWEADRLLQMEAELRNSVGHAELVKRRGAHVQVLEAALGGG
ncbi:unnamed protein product [Peniophora sp. CBMAI 1063]|nr:unnamed protein product [Peniophora sp. CBMAI 1063]